MTLEIKNNKARITLQNDLEEQFIFNMINFSVQLLKEQKEYLNLSKQLEKTVKKIFLKHETNQFLEKVQDLIYITDKESLLILLDNALFLIKESNYPNQELIENMNDIVEYLKGEEK